MTHMVIFRTPEGKPGYHHAEDLDGAIRFVERLRNVEGVTDARVFQMQEVPIEFRPYYRVEVGGRTETGGEVVDDAPAELDAVDAVADGSPRFSLFSRG